MPQHFEPPDPDRDQGAMVGLGFVFLVAGAILILMLALGSCGPKPAPSPSPSPSPTVEPSATPPPPECVPVLDHVSVVFEKRINHKISEKFPYGFIWLFRATGSDAKEEKVIPPGDCFKPPKFYQTLPEHFTEHPMETPSYDFYVGRVKPGVGEEGIYTVTACPYEQPPAHPGCRSVRMEIP